MNLELIIKYIEQQGTKEDRARLWHLLRRVNIRSTPFFQKFLDLQNPDGGWPFKFQQRSPSTISDTFSAISRLLEWDAVEPAYTRMITPFILRLQRWDGSWEENPAIQKLESMTWMQSTALERSLLATARACTALTFLGYWGESALNGLNFLVSHLQEEGWIKEHQLISGIALSSFLLLKSPIFEPTLEISNILLNTIDTIEEISWLAEIMKGLYMAHVPKSDPLVDKCLKVLKQAQQSDGGWKANRKKETSVKVTLSIIAVLKYYAILPEY
ncbi:MAG: hypothetical protein ACFFBD_04950 [Candidatus Hodarchaeota archaeon]